MGLDFLGVYMLKFLQTELGFGIICSLVMILLTHFLKKLFKTSIARKKYTPLITLGLGIVASICYYLIFKRGLLDFATIQAYISIGAFAMEMSIAATGLYITVKRIFSKATNEDVTLEDLFKTAEDILPQGLLLISNFTKGDITTAETLYNKIKDTVATSLNEKKETVEQAVSKVTTILNGWTDGGTLEITTQARMLVQSIKTELDAQEKKLAEQLAVEEKKEENK